MVESVVGFEDLGEDLDDWAGGGELLVEEVEEVGVLIWNELEAGVLELKSLVDIPTILLTRETLL